MRRIHAQDRVVHRIVALGNNGGRRVDLQRHCRDVAVEHAVVGHIGEAVGAVEAGVRIVHE